MSIQLTANFLTLSISDYRRIAGYIYLLELYVSAAGSARTEAKKRPVAPDGRPAYIQCGEITRLRQYFFQPLHEL